MQPPDIISPLFQGMQHLPPTEQQYGKNPKSQTHAAYYLESQGHNIHDNQKRENAMSKLVTMNNDGNPKPKLGKADGMMAKD